MVSNSPNMNRDKPTMDIDSLVPNVSRIGLLKARYIGQLEKRIAPLKALIEEREKM